jgi:hypothetical protein
MVSPTFACLIPCRLVMCADNRLNSLSITAASRAGRSSSSGSRLWSAGAAVIRRMSVFGRSGLLNSSMRTPAEPGSHAALHVSVRIGIATGRLPYGCELNNCAVKDRAKSEWGCWGTVEWGWCWAAQHGLLDRADRRLHASSSCLNTGRHAVNATATCCCHPSLAVLTPFCMPCVDARVPACCC